MAKVTIELELREAKNVAAIFALARLLELYDIYQPAIDQDTGVFNEDEREFWTHDLPKGIYRILVAIEGLFTQFHWDHANLQQLFGMDDEWTHAINSLTSQAANLRELRIESGMEGIAKLYPNVASGDHFVSENR